MLNIGRTGGPREHSMAWPLATSMVVSWNLGYPPSHLLLPRSSMYGIFTYIWVIYGVNVGKYTIHGWSGLVGLSSISHPFVGFEYVFRTPPYTFTIKTVRTPMLVISQLSWRAPPCHQWWLGSWTDLLCDVKFDLICELLINVIWSCYWLFVIIFTNYDIYTP